MSRRSRPSRRIPTNSSSSAISTSKRRTRRRSSATGARGRAWSASGFTFNQPHQKRYWSDGSLDWFWKACEQQGYVVGLLAGGYMKEFGKIAENHPASKSISTISAGTAAAPAVPTSRLGRISPRCSRLQTPNVGVKMSGAPSYSSQPYPYKNIHGYLQQIFDAFGPHRCFWGTDITRMPCSYRQCVTMFTDELPWLQGQRQGAGDGPRDLRVARLEASRAEIAVALTGALAGLPRLQTAPISREDVDLRVKPAGAGEGYVLPFQQRSI